MLTAQVRGRAPSRALSRSTSSAALLGVYLASTWCANARSPCAVNEARFRLLWAYTPVKSLRFAVKEAFDHWGREQVIECSLGRKELQRS